MNPNDDFDMDNMEGFLAEMDFLLDEDATATNTTITLDSSVPLRQPSRNSEFVTTCTGTSASTSVSTSTSTLTTNKKKKTKIHKSKSKHKKAVFRNSNDNSEILNQLQLVQFPPLHQPDALIYFPHSMTKFINSGDLHGLSHSMMKYFDKNCYVEFSPTQRWHYTGLLHLFSYTAELHPDSINYICGTKIDNNCIITSMYYKYTDNPNLTALIANKIRDPIIRNMICNSRGRFLQNIPLLESSFSNNINKGKEIITSNEDIIVYGKVDLVFILDESSQKVIGLKFLSEVSNISSAPLHSTVPIEEHFDDTDFRDIVQSTDSIILPAVATSTTTGTTTSTSSTTTASGNTD